MDSLAFGMLVFGPAVLGIGALVAAIYFFQRRSPTGKQEVWQHLIGGAFLVVALGIGACYGLMILG
jgi:hypothetical protein